MSKFLKRTWAEIELEAIRHNYSLVRSRVKKETAVMCIVKADAYGHGVEHVALEHQKLGADWFGVSNLEEALQLRSFGIDRPVLILGYTPPDKAFELSDSRLTQAVFSESYALELSECAKSAGCEVNCHIKLDTGMSRLGLGCHNSEQDSTAVDTAERIYKLPGLRCDGVFTHFAVADDGTAGEEFTRRQFTNFMSVINALEARGVSFRWRHCCNSAATLEYPEFHLDMVRPGIILYGLNPSPLFEGRYDLWPAMQLKSVISMVKTVEEGATVSYGRTHRTKSSTVLATVPIGYADGYPRPLSSRQDMLLCGRRAPIVGRICMDQLMLDVSGIEGVKAGMTVTVFGRDGEQFIPVDELSAKTDTINYETVCLIGKRVPRVYLDGGRTVAQVNYIMD